MKSFTEIFGVPKEDLSSIPASAHPTAEGPAEVAANIKYHAQYTPHFSPLKFEPEQAFYATADSVRDSLIQRWNETYLHFHRENPKQTYYLSMEYLQGRALTNAIGNLGITDAYAAALNKLGHDLENIVEQPLFAAKVELPRITTRVFLPSRCTSGVSHFLF